MSFLQAFSGKIIEIDDFDPAKTDGYDDYYIPDTYGNIRTDNIPLNPELAQGLRVITIKMGRSRLEKFVADPYLLEFIEDNDVKVVYAGTRVAAILNDMNGNYVYYMEPLREKYMKPRVSAGIKGAIASMIGGYILSLLALHKQMPGLSIVFESLFLFFFLGGIIYAVYYGCSTKEARLSMITFMRRLMIGKID